MIEFPVYKTFFIDGFGMPIYDLMSYSAVLVGAFLYGLEARKLKARYKEIFLALALLVAFLVIGARLFYFFGPWTWDKGWSIGFRMLRFVQFWRGGLVFYGGFFGAVFGIWLFTKLRKKNFWQHLDMWAAPMALAQAIARIGCFVVNDSCRGSITNFSWAVIRGESAIHAAPLYESFGMLALFFILMALKRKKHFVGFLILTETTYYSVLRFIIEFVRIQPKVFLGLTASQLISVALFAVSLLLLFKLRNKSK